MTTYEKFEQALEILGEEKMLLEVENYFSSNQLDGFLESIATDYEFDYEGGE